MVGGGDLPARVLGDRWRWLGRPAFLAAVGVLALNDHVLKHRLPGWWTGKLSDVAGVAVVGTLAAVLVGVRRGVLATAATFCALKAVPGVAEAAAPVLGGVTVRDRGDLVALGVLLPVALSLRRPTSRPSRRARRQVGAGASTVVPLLGAMAAVLVTTATSCAPEPAVTQVLARDGVLYALVDNGNGTGRWAESTDGGRSWRRGRAPDGRGVAVPRDLYDEPPPAGPLAACMTDGTCFRVTPQQVIERQAPGGAWVEELRLTADEAAELRSACTGGRAGILESIAVGGEVGAGVPPGPEPAVASLGPGGVLVRGEDGTWQRTRVLSVPPVSASAVERALFWGGLAFGPVIAVGLVLGRRRWPSWGPALGVVAVGWVAAWMGSGVLVFMLAPRRDPVRVASWFVVASAAVTLVTALAVARRPRRRPAPVLWWGLGPAPPAGWWTPRRPPPPPPPPTEGASTTSESDGWPPPG